MVTIFLEFHESCEHASNISMGSNYWIGFQDTTTMVEALGLLLSGYNSIELKDVGLINIMW